LQVVLVLMRMLTTGTQGSEILTWVAAAISTIESLWALVSAVRLSEFFSE